MLRQDREKDRERERRSEPSSPPPERPRHGGTATAGMYPGDGDEQRRWTRREDEPEATHAEVAHRDRPAHAKQR